MRRSNGGTLHLRIRSHLDAAGENLRVLSADVRADDLRLVHRRRALVDDGAAEDGDQPRGVGLHWATAMLVVGDPGGPDLRKRSGRLCGRYLRRSVRQCCALAGAGRRREDDDGAIYCRAEVQEPTHGDSGQGGLNGDVLLLLSRGSIVVLAVDQGSLPDCQKDGKEK